MKNKYIHSGRIQQKLKTRGKILSTTQHLLSMRNTFTLEDIAKKAQISRATIYRYYSNIDTLTMEASLDIRTKSPEALFQELKGLDLTKIFKKTQEYFNRLAINNEQSFRKFLSLVLLDKSIEQKRGARRTQTLLLALKNNTKKFDKEQLENLCNVATLFMGIESMVVMKDVCGLNDEKALKTLSWGFDIFLKGVFDELSDS